MKSEAQTIFSAEAAPLGITFVVLPGASILCVASSIDPLRAANRISGETLYHWKLVSADGRDPDTSSSMPVKVSGRFDPDARDEVIVVIAGFGVSAFSRGSFIAGLRKAARRARAVGGVEAGAWLLGHAGLLENRAATTHWEDFEDFRSAFPAAHVRPDRYVIDGKVFTTGGASPTFDLMLHLIRSRQGMGMALNVASVFIYDQSRAPGDAQPLVSLGRIDDRDPRIAAAIRLMESHLDAPLTIEAIARRLKTSQRTLEKEFNRLIGEPPGRYYLNLRLAAARKLVSDTGLPMTEIAARTGFTSAATFSRAFRAEYGSAPRALRAGV
jgi:transcriptional regulator GlxA family with amidase domain